MPEAILALVVSISCDTRKCTKRLESAGLPQEKAEAIAEAFAE
jgi:hypothetical protein